MMGFKDQPVRTQFFSNSICLFALSGIIGGKLRGDSLGNAEMFRPVVVPRNRNGP